MNVRVIILLATVGALAALVVCELQLRDARRVAVASRTEMLARIAAGEDASRQLQKDIEEAKAQLASQRQAAARKRATAPAATESATGKSGAPNAGGSATARIARDPELRDLSVRAYVAERRMLFAGLFQRLGLTLEQLHRFDAIQAEFQQRMLDAAAATESGEIRRQAANARDAQLRELLGDSYAAWDEASRTQGARSNIGALLQQTFQSTGPLDNARSERLIEIAASHSLSGPGGGFDWPAIAADAATVLSGEQLEAFRTAAAYREASERMNKLKSAKH